MTERQHQFGHLLQQARGAAKLGRSELAERVGLNASYIYRVEMGDRRPSRESVLGLAAVLGVDGEVLGRWLVAAGYAPQPLLTMVRAAVRTRGGGRRAGGEAVASPGQDAALWARLEAMGLDEAGLGRLLQAMEMATTTEQRELARAVSTTFSRLAEALEAPVRTAVIPAAGGQHRLLAPHVMQRLLLRAISEAVESGLSNIVLVLAPGTVEFLYTPLKEAMELAVIPSVKVYYALQVKTDGLGDAVLQAEAVVGEGPFAVLLPDDVVRERLSRAASPRELRRMMEAFGQISHAPLLAVGPVPKSKLSHCGVARVAAKEVIAGVRPITQLVEKPDLTDPICRGPRAVGIIGRYLLPPAIFRLLRELKAKGRRPVELTEALERLRRQGQNVYAFELEATRQDVGEVLGHARELIGDASP
jgi:UTP--glucose-1-phosphate uridylyltransferase